LNSISNITEKFFYPEEEKLSSKKEKKYIEDTYLPFLLYLKKKLQGYPTS